MNIRGSGFSALVVQESRVFKAGNSLALRIPIAVAKRIDLDEGTPVEIAVEHGIMLVRRMRSESIADLVERITSANVHEATFDEFVGNEVW